MSPDPDPESTPDEWDDLDADQAFRVGVLTELTQIRRALEVIAYGEGGLPDQRQEEDDTSPAPLFEGRSCGDVVDGVQEAEHHAVTHHNAPADGSTWRGLMVRVEPDP